MAIKANASSQGVDFKRFVGVASFRVLGVNPSKKELEQFYGNEQTNEPVYLKDKTDEKDDNKPYKQLRVSFLLQADREYEDGTPIKENANLAEPLKTMVSFFVDSRYFYNKDKTKVQVIDKYARTAWVTIEQCKNHQIPVYKNGPARLSTDYRPAYRGEEELTSFMLNYLNATPIDAYNRNTGEWIENPHPEDCEGTLEKIKDYFNGDISELKEYVSLIPTNRVKLLVGVRTDDQGKQSQSVYTRLSMRNGAKSYRPFKDSLASQTSTNIVWTNDGAGNIHNIEEYKENVKETNFAAPADDPFAASDLPFAEDSDPFAEK
jgi:hypothetical protein